MPLSSSASKSKLRRCFLLIATSVMFRRVALCLSPSKGITRNAGGACGGRNCWHPHSPSAASGRGAKLPRASSSIPAAETATSSSSNERERIRARRHREKLILWRGEKSSGYSRDFRHCEFANALAAATGGRDPPPLQFADALTYDAEEQFSPEQAKLFGCAAQFVTTAADCAAGIDDSPLLPLAAEELVAATKRSSLVRESYEVLAEGDTYEDLAEMVLSNGALDDVMTGGEHGNATWRIRLRQYGSKSNNKKSRRVGKNVRSPLRAEKKAILSMADLLIKLGGQVCLKDPECSLYLLEGLKGRKKVFARLLAKGPKTSGLAPKNRICATNTPLEPVAAFSLCNVARIRDGQAVLDPYAGSCATLLAAASLVPSCRTVGIEIAHNGLVNRDDVLLDFSSRGLPPPAGIIRGSCASQAVRDLARGAIDGEPFDVIVTDPPYGIRETTDIATEPPLAQLLTAMVEDRDAGTPLLKKGGRLVAFVPNVAGEDPRANLPTFEQMEEAGVSLTEMKEQSLNDYLSRWLVAFDCKR